jgi:hypothetical protein
VSVQVQAQSTLRPDGTVTHYVRIVDVGIDVSETCSATGPSKMPTLQRCAELAYEKLHRIARDAGAIMVAHGLLEKKLPDQGPYR